MSHKESLSIPRLAIPLIGYVLSKPALELTEVGAERLKKVGGDDLRPVREVETWAIAKSEWVIYSSSCLNGREALSVVTGCIAADNVSVVEDTHSLVTLCTSHRCRPLTPQPCYTWWMRCGEDDMRGSRLQTDRVPPARQSSVFSDQPEMP